MPEEEKRKILSQVLWRHLKRTSSVCLSVKNLYISDQVNQPTAALQRTGHFLQKAFIKKKLLNSYILYAMLVEIWFQVILHHNDLFKGVRDAQK